MMYVIQSSDGPLRARDYDVGMFATDADGIMWAIGYEPIYASGSMVESDVKRWYRVPIMPPA